MTDPQEVTAQELAEIRAQSLVPFGYAMGSYMNKCPICEEVFTGDKRAFRCKPCATKFALEQARAFGKTEAHLVVLLAALDAAKARIAEQDAKIAQMTERLGIELFNKHNLSAANVQLKRDLEHALTTPTPECG